MELSLSREDAAFRDEVRTFVAKNYPHEMRVPNPETDLTKPLLQTGRCHQRPVRRSDLPSDALCAEFDCSRHDIYVASNQR
jgi:hypothetical protein